MNDQVFVLFSSRFPEDRSPVEAVAGVGSGAQGVQDDAPLGGGGGARDGGAAQRGRAPQTELLRQPVLLHLQRRLHLRQRRYLTAAHQ